jgi:molecular chaperone DnaK (HSP70)
MGRSLADVSADLAFLPYEVIEGPQRTARVRLPDGSVVSPQEVSAAILRRLKQIAEDSLGVAVSRAVVTVPAYFDDAQRQATRDAGRLAGLEVVRIVNEPTAAALAYGLGTTGAARTVAVYDLGGGTFDISILRITPPEPGSPEPAFFQVLSTAGDTRLGGDDLDHALAAHLAERLGIELTDESVRAGLVREAERVKIALSDADSASAEWNGREVAITREAFESLVAPLIERTLASCARARQDAGLTGPPDAVVLVGGSTRVPLVRRRVEESFGIAPYTAIDPDRAVALGAAVQASILSGSSRGALLLDVIPLSLGIETAGGAVAKVIMRNSTVPTRAREMFSTQVDGQTSIRLHVLQGEREMAEHCRSLGVFHLRGIPAMPAGLPQVEVEFLVDANGVLSVSAHERRSGRRANLQIVPNHGLTREEVEQIERDSLTHAKEDMTRHRVVDLVVNSRLDLKWIRDRIEKFGSKLPPDDLATVQAATDELARFVEAGSADWKSVDPDAFHRCKERLDRLSLRLQEIAIAESLRNAPDARR